jgi:hypothetical protein
MGPASDPEAVVDSSGQVHGLDGLLVADAAIMPHVTLANTNLPTFVGAEKDRPRPAGTRVKGDGLSAIGFGRLRLTTRDSYSSRLLDSLAFPRFFQPVHAPATCRVAALRRFQTLTVAIERSKAASAGSS